MTQLFDTETYADELASGRHLRSIPAIDDSQITDRSTQWRLDPATIETGRRGLEAAREALQQASRPPATSKPAKRAA